MIPVYEPLIGDDEITAVVDALRRGEISGTWGSTIRKFEDDFASYCGCEHGVAVSSGTTALHLAVASLGIGPGDEVLVSSSTNIATALAVVHNGAVPVPVDAEPDTWNLNLDLIESLITPRTRGIIPVHLFGHPVDMDRLVAIARRRDLLVIEDCAEAHGATCRNGKVGSFGDAACFSFYANKIITTGEGGMVVTNDEELAERLRRLRNLAFGEPRFVHRELGFNFRMTGYQAAMGVVQLRRIEEIIEVKREIARLYHEALSPIRGLTLPVEREWARSVYWVYGVVVDEDAPFDRTTLIAGLDEAGIQTRTFFCPMNLQPALRSFEGFRRVASPVAERLWERGLYLPSGPTLRPDQIQQIADVIGEIVRSAP